MIFCLIEHGFTHKETYKIVISNNPNSPFAANAAPQERNAPYNKYTFPDLKYLITKETESRANDMPSVNPTEYGNIILNKVPLKPDAISTVKHNSKVILLSKKLTAIEYNDNTNSVITSSPHISNVKMLVPKRVYISATN